MGGITSPCPNPTAHSKYSEELLHVLCTLNYET